MPGVRLAQAGALALVVLLLSTVVSGRASLAVAVPCNTKLCPVVDGSHLAAGSGVVFCASRHFAQGLQPLASKCVSSHPLGVVGAHHIRVCVRRETLGLTKRRAQLLQQTAIPRCVPSPHSKNTPRVLVWATSATHGSLSFSTGFPQGAHPHDPNTGIHEDGGSASGSLAGMTRRENMAPHAPPKRQGQQEAAGGLSPRSFQLNGRWEARLDDPMGRWAPCKSACNHLRLRQACGCLPGSDLEPSFFMGDCRLVPQSMLARIEAEAFQAAVWLATEVAQDELEQAGDMDSAEEDAAVAAS